MTAEQRVNRMLEILEDLLPIAFLPQDEFYQADRREEAGAYAAAVGRCASKLPREFREVHPEIDWPALDELRYAAFHDGIDVLILRDRLQEILPDLKERLEKIVAGDSAAG